MNSRYFRTEGEELPAAARPMGKRSQSLCLLPIIMGIFRGGHENLMLPSYGIWPDQTFKMLFFCINLKDENNVQIQFIKQIGNYSL